MKDQFHDIWAAFHNSPFWIGAVGAITGIMIPTEKVSFGRKLAHIFVGATVAGFATPLLAYFISPEKTNLISALSFVCGMCGMWLAGGAISLAKSFAKDPGGFIKKWRHGKDS